MTKIAVLVGSLRSGSINKMLTKSLESLAPAGTEFTYLNIDLPLFHQELEANLPVEITNLKNAIESADGILIITPEYNRSFPGVLKNAIDWASRPWGHNSFKGKPVGITGISEGPTGTAQAQAQLRNVMIYLDTKLMGQPELYANLSYIFDENSNVIDGSKDHLVNYINAVVAHIESNK